MAGFAITVAAFYPGIMSVDSIQQYEQSLTRLYSDHHPPLMAWLWSLANHVVQGPQAIFMLHAALIWSALWLFAEGAARRGIRHGWLLVAAGFLPPILSIEGMVWKDVGMAASLLFATATIYRASAPTGEFVADVGGRIGRIPAAIALLFIFYAMSVRVNAPAAAVPILVYWTVCTFAHAPWRTTLRTAGALLAMMLLLQWGLETRVLAARRDHVAQVLELFDVAAIRCGGGDAAIPAAFIRNQPHAMPLCAAFDSRDADLLLFIPYAPLAMTTDRSALRELGRAWRHAVAGSPGIYLAHRARAFAAVLGFGIPDAPRIYWAPFSVGNPYAITFTPNTLTDAIGHAAAFCGTLALYNGLPWLLAAFVVAAFAWRRRAQDIRCEAALAASAITYTLPYFVVALAPDFRYVYWTVMASLLAALLTLLSRVRAVSR